MITSARTIHFHGITVGEDSSTTKEEWDQYAQSNRFSSCYHLSHWMRSIEQAYGHTCYWIAARRERAMDDSGENQSKICGILPLVHIKHFLFGNSLVSLPFADLGGILADEPAVEEALLQFAAALRKKVGAKKLELRSTGSPNATGVMQELDMHVASWKILMTRDLPGDPDLLFQKFKPKLRSQIRKPEKEGMQFRMGDASLLGDFYQVFRENMRDLGSPVHSREWFHAVAGGYGQRSRLGVVYCKEEPVAAGIVLFHRDTVTIPWASSLRRYNVAGPNMLLYWNFLKFACENGYKRFDFGRCTPGSGTYKFKEQWGAQQKPIYRVNAGNHVKRNGIGDSEEGTGRRNRKRELVMQVWSKFPLPIASSFGPMIRKYISL